MDASASVHFFPFYPPPSDQHPLPSPFPPPPPPSHIVPPPPPPSSRPHHPPPLPPHFAPPPPPLPHFPPPQYPRPHQPPPPPHILPPPSPPGHHVIIVVVISFGSLFFLAFLAVILFCYLKKRRSCTNTRIIKFDEHLKVQEAIVPGPRGEPTRVVMLEEYINLEEDIHKTEKLSLATHLNSPGGNAIDIPGPNHHLIDHKVQIKRDVRG